MYRHISLKYDKMSLLFPGIP
jgi:hypothetical protein